MNRKLAIMLIIFLLMTQTAVLAEDELLETDMFDKHGSVMLLINSETGEILDANPAAMEFYGYSHEQLTSMNITDINTLSKEEVKKEMDLAANQERNYFLFKHRLEDGSIRAVEVYSSPVASDQGDLCSFQSCTM